MAPVPGSVVGSVSGSRLSTESHIGPRRRFKSSRLVGDFEKPWLNSNGKRQINWDSIIFYTCIAIGLGECAPRLRRPRCAGNEAPPAKVALPLTDTHCPRYWRVPLLEGNAGCPQPRGEHTLQYLTQGDCRRVLPSRQGRC